MNEETPNLIKYTNPYLIYQGKDSKEKFDQIDLKDYILIKESKYNQKIQILKWMDDLENNSNIEEVLNTIITSLVRED